MVLSSPHRTGRVDGRVPGVSSSPGCSGGLKISLLKFSLRGLVGGQKSNLARKVLLDLRLCAAGWSVFRGPSVILELPEMQYGLLRPFALPGPR